MLLFVEESSEVMYFATSFVRTWVDNIIFILPPLYGIEAGEVISSVPVAYLYPRETGKILHFFYVHGKIMKLFFLHLPVSGGCQ